MIHKRCTIQYMFLFLGMYLYSSSFCAQTSFKLSKEKSFYYFDATVNGHENTRLLAESGIPGILISESEFERLFNECQFEKIDSAPTEIVNQLGTTQVKQLLKGKIRIGDLSYRGSIWVVGKHKILSETDIAIPIHRLKNEKDSTAYVIQLDFKKNMLDMVRESSIDKSKMKSYKIVEIHPKPIFESTLFLADTSGHYGSLSGRFLLDFGNPMPLDLFYNNSETRKFLKENNFRITEAADKKGKKIESGMYALNASKIKLGDKKMTNITIAITTAFKKMREIGFVGPSFFRGRVLIDEKNSFIYYE